MRYSLLIVSVALPLSRTVLAAEMTVGQFLAPPSLGEIAMEAEVSGRIAVQKTPGAHTGHRILSAQLPLQRPSKGGAGAARPYGF